MILFLIYYNYYIMIALLHNFPALVDILFFFYPKKVVFYLNFDVKSGLSGVKWFNLYVERDMFVES